MDTTAPELPDRIGGYEITGILGEGGMGTVYRARQHEPVRRDVALKVVKLGLDSATVLARFDQERQALAVMSHDAIARVFDAGTTERGQPFFVMELVDGVPITDYCEAHGLPLDARIALFCQVCQGVQHAHQKGVIHRDLKPSNVLVTHREAQPVPKIIDFGLARATDQQLIEQTLHTEHGQLIGTPEYMSPEQARGVPDAIDTRSDIYSLGVLLYQMLSGQLPFSAEEFRDAGLLETLRKIREDEPPRPSTKVLNRPSSLTRALRGDLDWIVMKAIAKEPERRYETASSLAADLVRFQAHEPVLAGPPSASYRLKKLLRRYRGQVAALALVFLALAGGVVAFALENSRARTNAELASRRAVTAQNVVAFLVRMFEASNPETAKGEEPTIREYLRIAATEIAELDAEPGTQADLAETVGHLLSIHSDYEAAKRLLALALAYREARAEQDPLALGHCLQVGANNANWTNEPERAAELCHRAIAIYEREHVPLPRLAQALNTLGNALQRQGQIEPALAAHGRALEIRERVLPADHADLAQTLHNIGILHYLRDDLDKAVEFYTRSIDIEKLHGTNNHNYATSLHTLAMAYQELWRLDLAVRLELESLAIREKVLGPDHDHVAMSLTTLGNIYRLAGDAGRACAPQRRAVAIVERILGPTDPELAWHRTSLLESLIAHQELDSADELVGRLLDAAQAGADETALADAHNLRGRVRLMQGQFDAARADFDRAHEICAAADAIPSPPAAEALAGLARVDLHSRQLQRARKRHARATDMLEATSARTSPSWLRIRGEFAVELRACGHAAVADAIRTEVDAVYRRVRVLPEAASGSHK